MSQFTVNKSAKMKIDNALAYFIVTNMIPYSLVEKEGFNAFVIALNSSYKLTSKKTITESRIPTMYSVTRNIIQNIISGANFLTFTTDCWNSSSNQPLVGLTCHFIKANFKLISACLCCIELSENHTGEIIISDVVQLIILDYEILDWKTCSIVSDYGSNMLKAVRNFNVLTTFSLFWSCPVTPSSLKKSGSTLPKDHPPSHKTKSHKTARESHTLYLSNNCIFEIK